MKKPCKTFFLQQGALEVHPDYFDGNVLEFKYYITTIEEMVESASKIRINVTPDWSTIHLQSTQADPNEFIQKHLQEKLVLTSSNKV